MSKPFAALTKWLANWFISFGSFLEGVGRPAIRKSKFVNLAPTDQADKDGVYTEALLFATADPKVTNIALTGPYGSGKSSIIQTFLKRYRSPPLHISLAAFVKEASVPSDKETSAPSDEEASTPSLKVSRQEIERSILQQMLYGADANRLPLSRFKRIQSPGVLAILISFYITCGLLSLWYVFTMRDSIISGTFFDPLAFSNWPNLGVFGFSMLFLWVALHYFYVASFGLSLKSISLKDIEIRPASDNQESILNRHLDEIIYFFQVTNYDLVIIEDLDRFEDAEIFVILREINSLVNKNAGVKKTIRFLYALRDDVFVNTDRTKFFEFIIPVIPIINASNSIDMVLEQGKRLEIDGRLDPQFLREVSRYLNDLRLIQNIFNEYAIYVANLETDDDNNLDANKLLAILIYKNVHPKDFEQLHRGEGNLAAILGRHDELVAHGEAACKAEIAELEHKIDIAEQQTPSDLKELRQIYAMALIEKLPVNVNSVSTDRHSWVKIPELVGSDAFEQLISASQVFYQIFRSNQGQLNISELQNEVDGQKSYLQRKAEIEHKSEANKSESLQRIRELRAKFATLRTTKFNELVRSGADLVSDLFDRFGENGALARFLILEGHLDDTYYQYTSLFHSGRLSPNDNKFLIQIRAFTTPDPGFQIDNPKEVIAAMRDGDFAQSYVLNVKLVDCLLSEPSQYSDEISRLLEFIASHFYDCEEFFEAYYATGRAVPELLSRLADEWKQLVPTVITSKRNISHITQLVLNLPEVALETLSCDCDDFSDFVAANLPKILALAPDLAPERLERIDFEVRDLPAIGTFTGIVHFMVRKGLFEISTTNLEHVYREVLGETNLTSFRERNYSTIRSLTDLALMTRVKRDFDSYLRDVLLQLEDNSKEDADAITEILLREELDADNLREFLERQTALIPTLDVVPFGLRAMMFELRRIEPTWENCIAFMEGNGFVAEILAAYLDREDVRAPILKHPLPDDPKTMSLRRFIVNADLLSDESYREYVRALPNKFGNFPESLSSSKLTILIEERNIAFSKQSLDTLDVNTDLPVLFVADNIDAYLTSPDVFGLDDAFREELLKADITDGYKRSIIDLMEMTALTERPERAAIIGPILNHTNADMPALDAATARSLILNSRPIETQISLFNKIHFCMTVDEACQVLTELPKPFSEITTGYHIPRLRRSDENHELVQWLEKRGIISSWSEGGGWFSSDEIRVNLKRR
ncbi:ATP-binding protein [Hoeflea sp.]|uniref:YobI family P-loop NTPase n=1 Tax=Hoeflea sp. TaxID=1940281 RepID=UPI003A948562